MKKIISLLLMFLLVVGCQSNDPIHTSGKNIRYLTSDQNMRTLNKKNVLSVHIYSSIYGEYTTSDEAEIKEVVNAFKMIKIGKCLGECQIDDSNYVYIEFMFKDGDLAGHQFDDGKQTIYMTDDNNRRIVYELKNSTRFFDIVARKCS